MSERRYPKKMVMVEGGITEPTPANIARRGELEKRGAESVIAFVRALWAIQTEGLFRWSHTTWAEYLKEVWGMSRQKLNLMQREAAGHSEISKRLDEAPVLQNGHKCGRLRPILTDQPTSRALARVPSEKLGAVLDDVQGSDSTVPIKVAVQKAIERHVETAPKPAKAPRTKKIEVSARADVLRIGNGLATAAGEYGDADLYNCVCAAGQQLRAVKARLR